MALKNALTGAWKTRKEFSIDILCKNMFLFKFESCDDKDWIVKNGPWLFDRNLLILETPKANQRVSDLDFKKVDFWVRIINLLLGYRNDCAARKIGNTIGEFLEWDNDKYSTIWGNSIIRARIKLDISKPLLRGFMLKPAGVGEDCWVTLRYKRLPDFCFCCGVIGHAAKECNDFRADEGSNSHRFEYGSWLKFQGFTKIAKIADICNNNEAASLKQDRVMEENVDDGQRKEEGLNGDMNQEVTQSDDLDHLENGKDIMDEPDNNIEYLGPKSRYTSSVRGYAKEMNEDMCNINLQGNEGVSNMVDPDVVSKRKASWKRRQRSIQGVYIQEEAAPVYKRKRVLVGEDSNKRHRGTDGDDMEQNDTTNTLAVAENQSCLEP